ncbi:hypothetical protein OCL06_11145 [Alteromonas sp. ASW11-19]|uniref:Nuclear transport factor 2 family protein n=1 Tax=Alteromonas salexigens TaxID=2982530 RepID=A0ABT2VPB0_9ALTE|nr:hypothetical protein [Alteromonas salexigens]MCU7555151.1 hypothetical protein [Alteromonas salexigens]
MTAEVRAFFRHMADALQQGDIGALETMFGRPTVFVTDGEKEACLSAGAIRDKLSGFIHIAREHLGLSLHIELIQLMKLADDTYFAQLNWQWKNAKQEVIRQRVSSFTLHQQAGALSVVVCVVDKPQLVNSEKVAS